MASSGVAAVEAWGSQLCLLSALLLPPLPACSRHSALISCKAAIAAHCTVQEVKFIAMIAIERVFSCAPIVGTSESILVRLLV